MRKDDEIQLVEGTWTGCPSTGNPHSVEYVEVDHSVWVDRQIDQFKWRLARQGLE